VVGAERFAASGWRSCSTPTAGLFRESPEICLFLQQVLLDRHHGRFSAQVAKVFSKHRALRRLDHRRRKKRPATVRRDVDSLTPRT
jgi:hypothetical protein